MAALAMIAGLTLWKLRVTLTGKEDSMPRHFLAMRSGIACLQTDLGHETFQNPALMNDVITIMRQNSPHTPA